MKMIAFVLWLIGWPLSWDVSKWINHGTDKMNAATAWFMIMTWIVVATLIYNHKGK